MIRGEGWAEMEGPGRAGAGDAIGVPNLDTLLGGATVSPEHGRRAAVIPRTAVAGRCPDQAGGPNVSSEGHGSGARTEEGRRRTRAAKSTRRFPREAPLPDHIVARLVALPVTRRVDGLS